MTTRKTIQRSAPLLAALLWLASPAQAADGGGYLLGDGNGGWTVHRFDERQDRSREEWRSRDGRRYLQQRDPQDRQRDDWRDRQRGYERDRTPYRRHEGEWRDRWRRHDDRRDRHDERRRRDRAVILRPEVDIRLDGRSDPPPRRRAGGPDACHQARSDTWSTGPVDCPDPRPPERRQRWSSSP
ncbi:hypothetical protein [Modicisalibacter sp. 'Wilcox']|uniref:hypothetical protein n=1 Tax=Modicisalibacter sp. 'Wilcox' TaxID=2679914 RepID=UPI0007942225|nr:hypothetical protein [Modicisalibacter sp. 'Wilcox']KXS37561.1 MAG: pre-mRNA-processing factor 40 [Halomonadaceae bacterium T82-2]